MNKLLRQSLTAYAGPLCETVVDCPQPKDGEILVRVERCGVCHSDLHVQDGYFQLAGERKLDIGAGRRLPFTLGHEIAGVVESTGRAARAVAIGRKVAVYPWIGCGTCRACREGVENHCLDPRHLGINVDGGFASHVIVPHERYLIDYSPLPASVAGAAMCSGLTAYAALKRLADRARDAPLLLIGLGGVGMMGLALARTMFAPAPIVVDVDSNKRAAALAAGAAAAFDPAEPATRKAVLAATGGVSAICDFVGSEKSLQFAIGVLAKGGKIVVTGLFGGDFPTGAAMFALKAMAIEGILTGTLDEARELMALARMGKFAAPPYDERPLSRAQSALEDLRAGRVVGRIVLVP
ncbi:MAG: alcohol dehydrogenase catalytic domain-containing protein [Proteobacteria bacterium]|nr:alcohol dehydrogenase catalytic domain-containing protein [Pseudomonadota bacterium]